MNGKQNNRKVFKTFDDFEKEYFPNAHTRLVTEESKNNPQTYGIQIAADLLNQIKTRLSK